MFSYLPYIARSNIPDYDGTSAYAVIDRNQPSFTEEEYTTDSYEYYSELDSLGRCGVAEACVGVDLMPTEERELSLIHILGLRRRNTHTSGKIRMDSAVTNFRFRGRL